VTTGRPTRAPGAEESAVRDQVAVVGLGYVGLPTACMFAVNGLRVLGVDSNPDVINELLDGRPRAVEPEIRSLLQGAIDSGNLRLSVQLERCDAYVVSVPTPVGDDRVADLSYVRSALASIVKVAARGNLVIVESTIPPGTMLGVVLPVLRGAGFEPGRDLLVAHCPERVLPGATTILELVQNDRVIGGFDAASASRAKELYSAFVKGSLHLTGITTAEFVKVIENTYRDVNIALANEFAKLAEVVDVDVWEAINLANNHPRVNVLRPGPGVGGHCVAVDPWFLVQLDASRARVIRAAREANDGMPRHVVERLVNEVNLEDGAVAMLGLAYRADLGDIRESPALAVHRELTRRGVKVKAHDPLVSEPIPDIANLSLEEAVKDAAAVLIVTDHAAFRSLDPRSIAGLVAGRTVFDTRNCLDRDAWRAAGFRVLGLGRTEPDAP
jgi:UDP-N-acetyl-D-mannosaminuronic acid dehydrogenase